MATKLKLPDFPWDALAPYGDRARKHPGGIIDLSVGTPVDDTPAFIQESLRESSNAPGYPLTAGTAALKRAISDWAVRKLGAIGEFDVLPLIGSKEFVAWLPTFLEAKTVLFPEIAYPTYHVGTLIAHAQPNSVEVDPKNWPRADLAWINSPSNPTGRVHNESELDSVIQWAQKTNTVIASDECYFEFGHTADPVSILSRTKGENQNILAVHSFSKRSNMAGYRAAFVIGDPSLISKIREIRKHAGMIVPLPIQLAMITALSDDSHVEEQRRRYNNRRENLAPALIKNGFEISESGAGLYIWCTRNEEDWATIEWLADLGILAAPGSFYGAKGNRHVRIAMTATDAQIAQAVERLTSSAPN
ncbi:MAG: succinyldiaminopimelate transaminase [Actinomycetota bacterium]